MTVEDFSPGGPISLTQWESAANDLLQKTRAGTITWQKIQVWDWIQPIYQVRVGTRLVQMALEVAKHSADFLSVADWNDLAVGTYILKVYDGERCHILTSPPLATLSNLLGVVDSR